MNNKALAILVLSLLGFSIASSAVVPVRAQPDIFVRNPMTGDNNFIFNTNTTSVGFKFNATLWASGYGTPPVFAWQVRLNYNFSILNVTRAWTAMGDPAYIFTGHPSINPKPALGNGTVLLGDTSLDTSVTPGPNPAKLGTVEFKILMAPPAGGKLSTKLDIDNSDTTLLDDNLFDITPITKTSGIFEFGAAALPPPSISIAVDKTQVTIGSQVTISGQAKPNAAGATVAILYKLSTDLSWTSLANLTADSGGNYVFHWIPVTNGTFDLKSMWNGVESAVVSVVVSAKPLKTFDVNGDGKVDILDIALVAKSFGAYTSPQGIDPRWNSAYDFNNDNVIDIRDIVLVAMHFGMSV